VYTNRTKIDPTKNIKSWIFTIATNTAYDFLRSPKGRKSINLEEDDETFYAHSTYTTTEGLVTDVNAALDMIKLDYKKPIILYYKEGFSYQEIAEILSLPINTVKTHISRGKEQLKHILKNYGTN
jgi:RNA polymerase sigma-70 factor (ECF subfamily)